VISDLTTKKGDGHSPVLLKEVVEGLQPKPNSFYVDCTLGGGGHTRALLNVGGESVHVLGIDRDKEALLRFEKMFGLYGGRVELINDRHENLKMILEGRQADGILFDLGISSFMIDDADRGFSFNADGPLDMRFDRSQTETARTLINNYSQKELTKIFKKFGEEPFAGRVAKKIVAEREKGEITTTLQLAEIVTSALPYKKSRNHPATKVFQAIRIALNGELSGLSSCLEDAVHSLKQGGRLAVISFHSLEDRIVKKTFALLAKGCICPPDFPVCSCGVSPLLKSITRKPIKAGSEEVSINPRSRSALLRVVERLAV